MDAEFLGVRAGEGVGEGDRGVGRRGGAYDDANAVLRCKMWTEEDR
jgi:hypothetical protein